MDDIRGMVEDTDLSTPFLHFFTSDPQSQLEVLWHQSDSFCMNCSSIGFRKQGQGICLCHFLKGIQSLWSDLQLGSCATVKFVQPLSSRASWQLGGVLWFVSSNLLRLPPVEHLLAWHKLEMDLLCLLLFSVWGFWMSIPRACHHWGGVAVKACLGTGVSFTIPSNCFRMSEMEGVKPLGAALSWLPTGGTCSG